MAAAISLQLHVIPLILTVPIFLIPISIYITIIGLYSKKEHSITQDYGYYFTWAGIMLAACIEWILLYDKMGIIFGVIAGLAVAIGFVYLNRFKSKMIKVP